MPSGNPLSATQRWRRAQELGVLVDDEDKWLLYYYTWMIARNGYVVTSLRTGLRFPRQQGCKLHHAIMGSPWSADEVTDHINRNKRDNRRSNLRHASHSVSMLNRAWVEEAANMQWQYGRYHVRVQRDNLIYDLGKYADKQEAERVRDEFIANHHQL